MTWQSGKTSYNKLKKLNVARRNQDNRLLAKVKRKINNSAPPGTAKGTFYNAQINRTVLSDPRRLDFSNDEVKERPAYKAWLKVKNKVEHAEI